MSKTVITSADIQAKYEQLYLFLMDFLWEFQVVQALANLEIAIFKRFPDKDEMIMRLRNLEREVSYTYDDLAAEDQAEFKEAFEDLKETIDEYEDSGYELYSVEEVIDSPDDVVDAVEEINVTDTGKRKFKIGEIRKLTEEEKELQEEAARTLENPFGGEQ